MKLLARILLAFALIAPAFGQAIIHGNGDPTTLNPVPNCALNRFYVDDATQKLYIASQGSPCLWTFSGSSGASLTSTTVAALPASPAVGSIYAVTDASTIGSCASGGGSNVGICRWNGSSYDWIASSGGGVTLNPPGVNTDLPCILGVNVLGACDSGNFKYSSSTLFAPNLSLSGNSTIAGSESVAGSLFVGAGTPNEGTTGTDLNGTAEFVNTAGAVQLKACATSKRYCFLVVKESSCGGGTGCTTGNAWVQGAFTETDTFSNTAVVGNWFKGSTTAAKQIEDTGTANTSACPSGVTCLGYAMTAGSGAQTVVRTAPVIGPNTGAAQTNGIVFTGTPGTAVVQTGSELSLFEYKTDNTGIVNGAGLASSLFSAANQCLRVEFLFATSSSTSTVFKLYYGGTSVTTITAASLATGLSVTYVCATTNTSTEVINTAPTIFGSATVLPPGNTGVAVDGTVGQLIKLTTNAASGTITLKGAYITKLW